MSNNKNKKEKKKENKFSTTQRTRAGTRTGQGKEQNTRAGLSLTGQTKRQHTKYNLFIMCFYKEHKNKTELDLYIILCYNNSKVSYHLSYITLLLLPPVAAHWRSFFICAWKITTSQNAHRQAETWQGIPTYQQPNRTQPQGNVGRPRRQG